MTERELKILNQAREHHQDPRVVLPELGILDHSYTRFVYVRIFLGKKDSDENVLRELVSANSPRTLVELENLKYGREKDEHKAVQLLKEKGLNYVEEYLLPYPPPLKPGEFLQPIRD